MRRTVFCVGIMLFLAFVFSPKSTANSQMATQFPTPLATSELPVQHSHMIVSTTFEMEPLLSDYAQAYPNVSFTDYQIVFKGKNEWPDTPYTYIVVFSIPAKRAQGIRFWDYVDAWVKLNPGNKASASVVDSVFPQLKGPAVGNYRLGY